MFKFCDNGSGSGGVGSTGSQTVDAVKGDLFDGISGEFEAFHHEVLD